MEYSKEKVLKLISPVIEATGSMYVNGFSKAMEDAGVGPVKQITVMLLFIKNISSIDPSKFSSELREQMEKEEAKGEASNDNSPTKLDHSWDDVPNGITKDIKDTKESPLDPSWDSVPDGVTRRD